MYGTTYILILFALIAFIISGYYMIFKKETIKNLQGGGKVYFYFGFVVCCLILISGIIGFLVMWFSK